MSGLFCEGEYALLLLDRRRRYLVKLEKGKRFHTHRGFLDLDQIIGRPEGVAIESSMGVDFYVFKPSLWDYVESYERPTQILYPKDIGFILVYADIGPGCRVLEAGVGSGALTSFLAYHIRPTGRVYGYDVNPRFIEVARRNLERTGLLGYVELKLGDVYKGVDERDIDVAILDVPSPWLAIDPVYRSLKPGGFFVSFSPTIDQVEKLVESIEAHRGFIVLNVLESFTRSYKVRRGETRPETTMIAHTGYLLFARKLSLQF
ncbi:MAG: tRNA (adenine-N1)-methyltransferase [Candidatus Bathyarchaeota archaeon]|nr:tRNA (adenine-N1)-methyltransferase [Candidatus Bathyarchaeota archaeon]